MKSLNDIVKDNMSNGFTFVQARYKAAQEIVLSKIEKSEFVDKILLKGGIVMYNITQERRRTTSDLDFDFVRFDISKKQNIIKFIQALNKQDTHYKIQLVDIKPLKQDDYKGCGLKLLISDDFGSRPIDFTMDVGVHTLIGIEQNKMCFSFEDGKRLSLWVNPPEQMFVEKLFSLAKIGPNSRRFKDINDMYYLIKSGQMNINVVRQCLSLLLIGNKHRFSDDIDVINRAVFTLESDLFAFNFNENSTLWHDVDYQELKKSIIDYIYTL